MARLATLFAVLVAVGATATAAAPHNARDRVAPHAQQGRRGDYGHKNKCKPKTKTTAAPSAPTTAAPVSSSTTAAQSSGTPVVTTTAAASSSEGATTSAVDAASTSAALSPSAESSSAASTTSSEPASSTTSSTEEASTTSSAEASSTTSSSEAPTEAPTSSSDAASSTSEAASTSSEAASTTSPEAPPTQATAGAGNARDLLQLHNDFRAQYGAPAVTWSDEAAAIAERVAATCKMEHSGTQGFGENLSAAGVGQSSPAELFSPWAAEAGSYDYNNPVFSEAAGHFTQVVWKGTTSIGCAIKRCPGRTVLTNYDGEADFLVCEYAPPGNYAGQFEENVPRKQ
ncbi:hypothetical protein Q8F55_008137 [Vanrija albida]|uniref:SCP domain-containing protein n=1 Tax=Vanrija albida TaxID=181172 RepID=A0ABR3PVI0_9TREE